MCPLLFFIPMIMCYTHNVHIGMCGKAEKQQVISIF